MSGVPSSWRMEARNWYRMLNASMATILPAFNTRRMLADYVTGMYAPAAAKAAQLSANRCAAAQELADWKANVARRWSGVRLWLASDQPGPADFGDKVSISVRVDLNGLSPDDLRIELLVTREIPAGEHHPPVLTSFQDATSVLGVRDGKEAATGVFMPSEHRIDDGATLYSIAFVPPWSGQLLARVRAVPSHPDLSHPYEMGLMTWLAR